MRDDLQTIELLKSGFPTLPVKHLDDVGNDDRLFVFGNDGDEAVGNFQGLIEYCRDHEVSPRNLQIVGTASDDKNGGFRIDLTDDDIADIERDACLS